VAAKNNYTRRYFFLTDSKVAANTKLLAATYVWPLIIDY
jgi:hypothetical protein